MNQKELLAELVSRLTEDQKLDILKSIINGLDSEGYASLDVTYIVKEVIG